MNKITIRRLLFLPVSVIFLIASLLLYGLIIFVLKINEIWIFKTIPGAILGWLTIYIGTLIMSKRKFFYYVLLLISIILLILFLGLVKNTLSIGPSQGDIKLIDEVLINVLYSISHFYVVVGAILGVIWVKFKK